MLNQSFFKEKNAFIFGIIFILIISQCISTQAQSLGVSAVVNDTLNTACTVADYEVNGLSPVFSFAGSSGGNLVQLAVNPLKTGLNESARALRIKQTNETIWWSRLQITFAKPVKVKNNTRYLHLMVKTPLSSISVLTFEPKEHWFGSGVSRRNEWCDVVVDLMASTYNLNGTVLKGFGICSNSATFIPNNEWYVDQVSFSADAKARPLRTTFLDQITCEMTTEDTDWNFVDKNPLNTLKLTNNGISSVSFKLNINVRSASKDSIQYSQHDLTLAVGESKTIQHELVNPNPGFYRYYLDLTDGNVIRNKVIRQIGYNPDQMNIALDAEPDFDSFWNLAKAELASVAPMYKVTYKQTSGTHLIYDVEMKSIKGKTIKGYLSVPNKTGKFPAIVISFGYGVTATIPDRNDDYVAFAYNIRGQGISTDYTRTDDFFVNGLTDKNTYYYREAYMDALRAVDFICSRSEVDTTKIFAEGESQGGALTYVIAALDSRILAASPRLPFLADFPVYYNIKEKVNEIDEWPMYGLKQYMSKYNFPSATLFRNLSYFDLKNFARKIKCPILMCVGLQDATCPPSINFAAYNMVKQPKEYVILKTNGHYSSPSFISYKDAWYQKIINNMKTSVKEIKINDFDNQIHTSVYEKKLKIENTTGSPLHLTVYSVDGKLKNKMIIQKSNSLPIDSGIYFLSFSDYQNQTTRKVLVH